MKRLILSAVMAVLGFCALRTQAQAQPVPMDKFPTNLSFMSSKALFRGYAVGLARQADMDVKSPGLADFESGGFGWSWSGPTNEAGIRAHFDSWNYTLRMVNIKDVITFVGHIDTDDGDELFYSYPGQSVPQQVAGGSYYIPPPYLSFEFSSNGIPVRVDKSVVSAQMSYVDGNGTVIKTNLPIRNGKMYANPDFIGEGYAILSDAVGNKAVYDLRNNGNRTNLWDVRFYGLESFIDNYVVYSNVTSIDFTVWSNNGVGNNPTFELNQATAGYVNVGVKTREGALPRGYFIMPLGTTNITYLPRPLNAPPYLPVWFNTGPTILVPDWNPVDFKDPDPVIPQPDYYGSKDGSVG